jgi:hypothetical protein
VAKAAAVELAPLAGEGQQGGVDEQLFEEVRADVGRVRDAVPLCGLDALSVSESDLADE